ncbi:MAG TPA: hypothetical protein VHU84_05830, partial [Lacipirellulaceae bacterium]|nr:hypothetical protein [Lacipirellulaceae bacterium]
MLLRTQWVTALALSLAVTATGESAVAQSRSTSLYNNGPRMASQTAAVSAPPGQSVLSKSSTAPMSSTPMSSAPANGAGDVGYMSNGYPQGGYNDCQCSGGCGDQGCCESGCASGCCDSGGSGICNMMGMSNGEFFVTADYLAVHASFSQATARVIDDQGTGSDQFIPLDFNYQSSFRIGGGWKSCCCGDQVRFMYTQMTSDASTQAFFGDLVPEEAGPPPGGVTNIRANVDARTMDFECAKTIPLGGQCCECGDCCNPCCNGCPAWDLTWSGGVRWADVGWQESFVANDSDAFTV